MRKSVEHKKIYAALRVFLLKRSFQCSSKPCSGDGANSPMMAFSTFVLGPDQALAQLCPAATRRSRTMPQVPSSGPATSLGSIGLGLGFMGQKQSFRYLDMEFRW